MESRKQVGTLKGKPVWELVLKGGLHIIAAAVDSTIEYLGAGPHRAVARFLAKKKQPELLISALAKSDHIEPHIFAHMVPQWEDVVTRMNAARR